MTETSMTVQGWHLCKFQTLYRIILGWVGDERPKPVSDPQNWPVSTKFWPFLLTLAEILQEFWKIFWKINFKKKIQKTKKLEKNSEESIFSRYFYLFLRKFWDKIKKFYQLVPNFGYTIWFWGVGGCLKFGKPVT